MIPDTCTVKVISYHIMFCALIAHIKSLQKVNVIKSKVLDKDDCKLYS